MHRRQCSELQQRFDSTLKEKDNLKSQCQKMKWNLDSVQGELVRSRELVVVLQERLSKSEEERSSTQSIATSTQNTLSSMEHSHAKLVSEHASLQAALTAAEKQNTSLELELRAALEKSTELGRQEESLRHTLVSVENQLKVVSRACELKEQEVASCKRRAANLERERNELSLNLSKMQESAQKQGEMDAAKQSELEAQFTKLKTINHTLHDRISSLETSLESSRCQCNELDAKVGHSDHQVASLSSQLKHSDEVRRDVQMKYSQLLSVLEATLGLTPIGGDHEHSGTPEVAAIGALSSTMKSDLPSEAEKSTVDSSGRFIIAVGDHESGIGTSTGSLSFSSFTGVQTPEALKRAKNISGTSQMVLDVQLVRETILELQKQLVAEEKSKQEAMSSVIAMQKKIRSLEAEKASHEVRLQSLRSSLVSLQSSFDSVSKQRDSVQEMTKLQEEATQEHLREQRELKHQVKELKERLDEERVVKQASDTQLRKYAQVQAGHEIEKSKMEARVIELGLQKKQMEEDNGKLRSGMSYLQAMLTTKEAEVEQLRQQLETRQQLHFETENQVKSLRENMESLGQSFQLSKESEKKLLQRSQQLEAQLVEAQSKKFKHERNVSDLQQTLEFTRREYSVLEERLQLLTCSHAETDSQNRQLLERVRVLEKTVSSGEMTKTELTLHLQAVEMKLQEQDGSRQRLESQFAKAIQEKQALAERLEKLESSLEEAVKNKDTAKNLCTNLEKEVDQLRKDLQRIRSENVQLKNDLREAQFQRQQLDVLVSSQRRKQTELDQSLASSSKQNTELVSSVRELQASLTAKDKEHKERYIRML